MHTHTWRKLLITSLLSAMVTVVLGKRTGLYLVETFAVIYGIQKFITVSLVHITNQIDPAHILSFYVTKTYFNTISPSTPRSSKMSFFRLSNQNSL